jgi:hypothetical protein
MWRGVEGFILFLVIEVDEREREGASLLTEEGLEGLERGDIASG